MDTIVGIYRSKSDAREACRRLRREVPEARLRVLVRESDAREVAAALPTDDGEWSGLGKAVGGAVGTAAGSVEEALSMGLPKDELFVYEDALRQGRVVLAAVVDGAAGAAERVRSLMRRTHAESVDDARRWWWLGLRDVEAEHYRTQGLDFDADERLFRQGFEAAQLAERVGVPGRDVLRFLEERYPDVYHEDAFRRGWGRGRAHVVLVRAS
jgi:hypothetical protein